MSRAPARQPSRPEAERRARPNGGAGLLGAALRNTGTPLEAAVREPLEASFQHDLRRVRVHAGPRASAAADALNAHALTVGDDVLFGAGNFAPQRPEGRALLAHELAHVVQGRLSPPTADVQAAEQAPSQQPAVDSPDVERRARDAAGHALAGLPVSHASLGRRPFAQVSCFVRDQPISQSIEQADASPLEADVAVGNTLGDPAAADAVTARLRPEDREKRRKRARDAVAKAREAKDPVAAAPAWKAAAAACRALEEQDALDVLRGLAAPELASLDAVLVLSGAGDLALHRRIRFVQNPPPVVWSHGNEATVSSTGRRLAGQKVAGGQVDVRADPTFTIPSSLPPVVFLGSKAIHLPEEHHGFSLSYTGAQSTTTQWLQFVWREIEVDGANGTSRLDGLFSGFPLTTDPQAPWFHVDSLSALSPFYEAGATDNRTSNSTTIFDDPSAGRLAPEKNPFLTSPQTTYCISSRAHFITYLVRGPNVLYRVELLVEWDSEDGVTWSQPRTKRVSAAADTALDELHHKAMTADPRYQDRQGTSHFDYLPSKAPR